MSNGSSETYNENAQLYNYANLCLNRCTVASKLYMSIKAAYTALISKAQLSIQGHSN